ncbi:MAG: hypothetical protein FVQ79_00725 [Planctomycetes bacterium]|nr:hypothetical protein [Planctomycetota bacterium]
MYCRRSEKKLIEAARHWAGRASDKEAKTFEHAGDDEVIEDLKFFGATDELIDEYENRDKSDDNEKELFPVIEVNWPAVQAFLTVQSQFRSQGFMYEGVKAGLQMSQINCTDDLFLRLRVMESAVLEFLAERKD